MEADADPVIRRRLSDELVARLLADIRAGKLRPGEMIPSERALARTFQVGRMPVREAIQRLQVMGLVTVLPRKGTWIVPPGNAGAGS